MVEEAVAETDDELIEKFFNDESMTPEEIHKGLRIGIVDGTVTPVICGAAIYTIGIRVLMNSINKFLPPTNEVKATITAINPKLMITLKLIVMKMIHCQLLYLKQLQTLM